MPRPRARPQRLRTPTCADCHSTGADRDDGVLSSNVHAKWCTNLKDIKRGNPMKKRETDAASFSYSRRARRPDRALQPLTNLLAHAGRGARASGDRAAQPQAPAAKKQKTDYRFKHDVARLQKNLQEFEQDLKEHTAGATEARVHPLRARRPVPPPMNGGHQQSMMANSEIRSWGTHAPVRRSGLLPGPRGRRHRSLLEKW